MSTLRTFTFAAAVSCSACAGGMGSGGGGSDSATHPLVGVHAPDFSRPALIGAGPVATDAVRGKVAIIDFWATYCEPCLKSFPKLQSLADRHGGSVTVMGISEDDEKDGIAAFAKKTGVRFPIGWDDGKVIGQRYSIDTMPSTFVLDKRGVVRYVHRGYHDGEDTDIEREVTELLRGS